MQINTVQQFVEVCKSLNSEAIYDVFEDDCTQAVHDEIYEKYADFSSNEPTRSAMNALGLAFSVQSLYDY